MKNPADMQQPPSFTGGCNFRCPFCHNASLVLKPEKQPLIPAEEVFNHLEKRRGILEGVCITGGEPTLERELKQFMLQCRGMGLEIVAEGIETKELFL